MTRYIFTNSDSGGGALKFSRIAERVLPLGYELVHGPAPFTTKPLDFFAARTALWPDDTDSFEVEITSPIVAEKLASELQLALASDFIELWIDPDPNAQLQAAQLLDWLGSEPDALGKLVIHFLKQPLGEQTPEAVTRIEPVLVRVDERILETGRTCWSAFRQPTPRPWFDLLTADLRCLPEMRRTVEAMLLELPDAESGLLGTQRQILELVSAGFDTPQKLMSHPSWHDQTAVFDYWEQGRILCDLALCDDPVLSGMNGERFTLDLHESTSRHRAYLRGPLALTAFGKALLEGEADYADHNRIDRWWGGTHLTNLNLWRWNAPARQLVHPATNASPA